MAYYELCDKLVLGIVFKKMSRNMNNMILRMLHLSSKYLKYKLFYMHIKS